MKKVLENYGGLVLFYVVLVVGFWFLCSGITPANAKPSSFTTSVSSQK